MRPQFIYSPDLMFGVALTFAVCGCKHVSLMLGHGVFRVHFGRCRGEGMTDKEIYADAGTPRPD
jgi:hypothetical protein